MNRLIKRTLASWFAWRNRRKLHRAHPILAELDRQQAMCRAKHRRGSARIAKIRKEAMHAILAGRQVG